MGGGAQGTRLEEPHEHIHADTYILFAGYSLGGEAYWATGLHLFAPLLFARNELLRRIRLHTFATAGNLIQTSEL